MPRARKHRISTKPVFFEKGGGTERDEKFTLKYNKTISKFIQIHMALKTVWFTAVDTKGIWRS